VVNVVRTTSATHDRRVRRRRPDRYGADEVDAVPRRHFLYSLTVVTSDAILATTRRWFVMLRSGREEARARPCRWFGHCGLWRGNGARQGFRRRRGAHADHFFDIFDAHLFCPGFYRNSHGRFSGARGAERGATSRRPENRCAEAEPQSQAGTQDHRAAAGRVRRRLLPERGRHLRSPAE